MKKLEIFKCESCDAIFHSEQECLEHEHECSKLNKFNLFKHTISFNLDTCTYEYSIKEIMDAELIDKENEIYQIIKQTDDDYAEKIKIKIDKAAFEYANEFNPILLLTIYSVNKIDYEAMLKMHLKTYLLNKNEQFSKVISAL